jgi:hypothetical protein
MLPTLTTCASTHARLANAWRKPGATQLVWHLHGKAAQTQLQREHEPAAKVAAVVAGSDD